MSKMIKIRVWDAGNKRMIHLSGDHYLVGSTILILGEKGWEVGVTDYYEVDGLASSRYVANESGLVTDNPENELMLFTGLHDKNGREIWEGDVLSHSLGDCVVIFAAGQFSAVRETPAHLIVIPPHKFGQTFVAGNIYENPEFVKGEKRP